jgi:hypothetical protein
MRRVYRNLNDITHALTVYSISSSAAKRNRMGKGGCLSNLLPSCRPCHTLEMKEDARLVL